MDSSQLTDFIKVGGAESILEWGFGTGRFFVGTCLTLNMSFGGEGEGSDEGDRSQIIAHFQVRQSIVKVLGAYTRDQVHEDVSSVCRKPHHGWPMKQRRGASLDPFIPISPCANSSTHTDLSLHTEQSL